MSISGTVHGHGTYVKFSDSSMGGIEPGADFRRSRSVLRRAKLAVALRSYTPLFGDRCSLRLLRRDADHGQDFPQTSKYTLQAVALMQRRRGAGTVSTLHSLVRLCPVLARANINPQWYAQRHHPFHYFPDKGLHARHFLLRHLE